MTRERACLLVMLVSAFGVMVSIGYATGAAPAHWTRILFTAGVLAWLLSIAVYYFGNRK